MSRNVNFADLFDADARLGTNKIGPGAYGPNLVQGQSPISAKIRKSKL
jgi:hypothetical protein